jgi:predicted solute-binding protein
VLKRLGIISDRFAQPLYNLLRKEKKFLLLEDNPAELAIKLRHKELDGAFLSPIDYAKDYAMYRLIPQIAVASRGDSGATLLIFKEDTRMFKKIGVDPSHKSEIVLASIILSEKYEVHPQIIPTNAGLECLNQNVDACLVCGDAVMNLKDHRNKLDLVDEWQDISELPFVHGFWVTREGALTKEEIDSIIRSGEEGTAQVEHSIETDGRGESSLFSYTFGEIEIQAVSEFFRMAYYHGILEDIPEVRFTSPPHPLSPSPRVERGI